MKKDKIIIELKSIKKIICNNYNLAIDELNLKNRSVKYTEPRQLFHYFANKYTIETLKTIGKPYDHATVIHSIRTVSVRINLDREFSKKVCDIDDKLQNYYYCEIGNDILFNKMKNEIINNIKHSEDLFNLHNILNAYTKKTDTSDLKNQFEFELNNGSSDNRFDKSYYIGGAMRNVTHFKRYGTALKEFDVNLFNKLYSERLMSLLRSNKLKHFSADKLEHFDSNKVINL